MRVGSILGDVWLLEELILYTDWEICVINCLTYRVSSRDSKYFGFKDIFYLSKDKSINYLIYQFPYLLKNGYD